MGYVGWGLVAEQANTTTGGAQRTVGITSSPGAGIAQSSLNAVNNGGGGVVNNYGAVWDNLFVRQYLFGSGEQGVWLDPSDFQPNWRRNLLTWTEDFSNASWTKNEVTVANTTATTDPLGGNTADVITDNANNSFHVAYQGQTFLSDNYSFSIYAKKGTAQGVFIRIRDAFGGGTTYALAIVDLSDGSVLNSTGTVSVTFISNGWYRIVVSNSVVAGTRSVIVGTVDGGNTVYAGSGKTTFIWGAQLERGTQATAYQPITDGIVDYLTYQPQPILYQDSAGVTPVTALEQPCGLMLDKSKGLQLGPELVTNGDFSNGTTGWSVLNTATISESSGRALVNATATFSGIQQTLTTVVGKWYAVSLNIELGTSLAARAYLQNSVGPAVSSVVTTSGVKTLTFIGQATTTGMIVRADSNDKTGTFFVDNISVKELPGNHAYQTTSAKRPVVSARVNLLTNTDSVSTARTATTVASNYVLSFSGGNITLSGTATGTYAAGTHTITCTAGTLTLTPAGTSTLVDLRPADQATGIIPRYQRVGAATYGTSTSSGVADYDSVGFPIYLRTDGSDDAMLTNSINFGAGPSNPPIVGPELVTNGDFSSASGWTLTSGATISGGVLTCTTTTSTDVEARRAINVTSGKWYEAVIVKTSGAGTEDWAAVFADTNGSFFYRFGNLPAGTYKYIFLSVFTGTRTFGIGNYSDTPQTQTFDSVAIREIDSAYAPDKMTVWAGVRKLSDAAVSILYETSTNSGVFAGTFASQPSYSGSGSSFGAFWQANSNGNNFVSIATSATYPAPQTAVQTHIANISGDSLVLRVNGTQVASSTADQGTGNFGNYPLYLFARNQTATYFNGNFYGLIVRGAQTPASLITLTEEYISGVTGFGAPVVVGSPSIGVSI